MDHPEGADSARGGRVDFDPGVRLEFRDTQRGSDGGLRVIREPDGASSNRQAGKGYAFPAFVIPQPVMGKNNVGSVNGGVKTCQWGGAKVDQLTCAPWSVWPSFSPNYSSA